MGHVRTTMISKRIENIGHQRIAVVAVQLGNCAHQRLGAHQGYGVGIFVIVEQTGKGVYQKDSRIKHHRNYCNANCKKKSRIDGTVGNRQRWFDIQRSVKPRLF